MLKRFILVVVATLLFAFQFQVSSASALKLDESTRTVDLNEAGDQITFSSKQFNQGQKLFNSTCTQCHLQGKTKTNNNVSLGVEDLSGAEPPRNNVLALIDYLKHPTSYDGEVNLELEHPNTSRPDVWPEMRNITEDDLEAIAGYMLIQPNLDERWGGTIYF